jgi:hypothetical protein
LENTDIKPSDDITPPIGNKPKKGLAKKYVIVAFLVGIIVVFAAVVIGLGVFTPAVKFEIVSHDAQHIGSTNGVFWVQFSYTVKNVGKEAGNVTVIVNLITESETEPWSQTFYLGSGQSKEFSLTRMLQGDPEGYWVYQCYIQGETPQNFQHS